jgi:hypothetical protein
MHGSHHSKKHLLLILNQRRKDLLKKKKKNKAEESDEEPIPFIGDQTLAQSCRFMYDATISREVIYAIADGDIGRVWEVLKVYTHFYLKFDISIEENI